jgi:hypothetical protein
MNPTLPAEVVEEAMADDPVAARSEWLAAWREDVEPFLSEAALDQVTAERTGDLLPVPGQTYVGFLDMSGGSQDSSALAIAHGERRDGLWVSVLDVVEEVRPPFDAEAVTAQFAATLKRYGITHARADRFAGVWVVEAFARPGIHVEQSAAPKSELYLSFLPLVSAKRVELPDDGRLITQLAQLERRSRAGGRAVVDHPPGAHDDRANVVAGACVEAAQPAPLLGIQARGLSPTPLRVSLNLTSEDPLAAAAESFDYENEAGLWRIKGERPPWPSDWE